MISMLSFSGWSLRGFDLAPFYDAHAAFIDLCIYFMLFAGLAQATIGRHFNSRGGTAVSVAVGFMLAVGLAVSERSVGFNLRTLGSFAAILLIILVGVALFLGLRTAGMQTVGSLGFSVVVMYVALLVVVPQLADLFIAHPDIAVVIHVILVIAIGIVVFTGFKLLIPAGRQPWNPASLRRPFRPVAPSPEKRTRLASNIKEASFIKKKLVTITEAAEQTSQQIQDGMGKLKRLIATRGETLNGRQEIANSLNTISPKENRVFQALQYLKDVVQKLSTFDYRNFIKLREEFRNMPAGDRNQKRQELIDEWKKLGAEQELQRLEQSVAAYDRDFTQAVNMAVQSLKNHRSDEAVRWIDKSVTCEQQVQRILHDIRNLEQRIEKYTRQEINDEKREMKEENE